MNLILVILSGIAGSMLGALFNYWIALKWGRPIFEKYGKYFFVSKESLDKAEVFFEDVPTSEEALAAELKSKVEADPDVTILVRADERIVYGKVVSVLRLMHDAGISRMALVTDPQK